MFSYRHLFMDTPVLADHQKLKFIKCVWILYDIYQTYQEWWLIGADSGRNSKEAMLSVPFAADIWLN